MRKATSATAFATPALMARAIALHSVVGSALPHSTMESFCPPLSRAAVQPVAGGVRDVNDEMMVISTCRSRRHHHDRRVHRAPRRNTFKIDSCTIEIGREPPQRLSATVCEAAVTLVSRVSCVSTGCTCAALDGPDSPLQRASIAGRARGNG